MAALSALLGFFLGVLAFVVLLRLDPGPGPRRLATPEAWEQHEARVKRATPWFRVLLPVAIFAVVFIGFAGRDVRVGLYAAAAGFIAALAVVVVLRLRRQA